MDCVIPISDPAAADAAISGGKGANCRTLQELSQQQSGFLVPATFVLTTEAFAQLVLANPTVARERRGLARSAGLDPHVQDLESRARRLQEAIRTMELPANLEVRLRAEFERLGSEVAVRSSATCEDGQQHSAAGQGHTALYQTTLDGLFTSIKEVWASLFSPGFIQYREEIGYPHDRARMAVLLQTFIHPRAAGVVHSFDQGTGRPGYWISAQPGIGEGVVQPVGSVDHWFVGPLCEDDDILERMIAVKKRRVATNPGGGTREEKVLITDPCLDDPMVLAIARAARIVHERYREQGVDHIDIEYTVDERGQLYLVQARPKWFQKTGGSEGGLVVKTSAVDAARVPHGTELIRLSEASLIAVQGAVTAKLGVVCGDDAAKCLPGRIVVADHTNNEFNAIFGSLAAVITADGDQTSHAAQHAYEKRIPCVVGAAGVVEALAPYDGQLVTFDAATKTIYLGVAPIIEVQRDLEVWLTDRESIQGSQGTTNTHEAFRPWDVSKKKRPAVFREDFEGHHRLRSNIYGHFQLDYYYQAWDRLTAMLSSMFGQRTTRRLKTQARQIKALGAGQCLVHEVCDNDPESIYYYLMSVAGFGTADLERLFGARLDGFRRFAAFVNNLHIINEANVKQLVSELVCVFVWMHFGYWLDCIVESFARRQLRYIRDDGSFHNVLRDEAVADEYAEYRVDPLSSWIPPGRLLNLSRERDKEVFALVERIRSNVEFRAAFDHRNRAAVCPILKRRFPNELATIEGWSGKYKLTREHLDLESDTDEYIALLRKILEEGSTMPAAMLSAVYQQHLRSHHSTGQNASGVLAHLFRGDGELYWLCRAYARTVIAKEREAPLDAVPSADVDSRLADSVKALHLEATHDMRFRRHAAAQVLQSNYPDLKAILRISRLQVALREDGHHLIVPHQRTIARLMRDAAKSFVPRCLERPEDIFDISTDELIGIFHEPAPEFIALSPRRRRQLLEGEQELSKCWSVSKEDFRDVTRDVDRLWSWLSSEQVGLINRYGALQDKCRVLTDSSQLALDKTFRQEEKAIFATLMRPLTGLRAGIEKFESCVERTANVLQQQISAARLTETQQSYEAERARLQQRIDGLKRKAQHEGYF